MLKINMKCNKIALFISREFFSSQVYSRYAQAPAERTQLVDQYYCYTQAPAERKQLVHQQLFFNQ
jgi:hypothetical protein